MSTLLPGTQCSLSYLLGHLLASDNRAFYLLVSGLDTQVKREVNVRLKLLAIYNLLLMEQSQGALGYRV